jgi:mRNA-degrading endonuclease RelE of RelBE toxin-antitoxin system
VWVVKLIPNSRRQLQELPDALREACLDVIEDLREGEFPSDRTPLRGHRMFERLKFHRKAYRMIYRINSRTRTIVITRIVKRDERTYKGFGPG